MREPTTYAEWSACLDILASGEQDQDVVNAMSNGQVNWASGWAELFSERLFETINVRLNRCADRMDREFALGFSEPVIVRAMLDTRRTLSLLHRVANLPSFPQILQTNISEEINKYAKSAQQSLENSAKNDRSGQLSRMIRYNCLLDYTKDATSSVKPMDDVNGYPKKAPRNIIQSTNTNGHSSSTKGERSVLGFFAALWRH